MVMSEGITGLSQAKVIQKRAFDIVCSVLGLVILWWLILLTALLAWLTTGQNGFFVQRRIGRFGRVFKVIKIRTMRSIDNVVTTVTTDNDLRITPLGRFFRKTKIDELPQLINILLGDMSFVGPRPDVPGFADKLNDDDKIILSIRPGITGPATLAYKNEEKLLVSVDNPEKYNQDIIFPDKVRINKEYIKNYSLFSDIRYIFITIFL
jgi:lipopolysaccharide/colanic/teichoic acid biosynthesis glycosyltransferase